jgi:hypothetical protein
MSLNDFAIAGDAPDTFEGRLAAVTRLIDTADDEIDERRRIARRALVIRLLLDLTQETNRLIVIQLDRLEFE